MIQQESITDVFNGNGSATFWSISWKIFTDSSGNAEVSAVKTDTSGVDTPLTLGSDFTVALNSDQDMNPGGTFTYLGATLAVGEKITVTSAPDFLQETDLKIQGGWSPSIIEQMADRAVALARRAWDKAARAFTIPVSDDTARVTELPNAATRAGKLFGFDSNGDPLMQSVTGEGSIVGMDPTSSDSTRSKALSDDDGNWLYGKEGNNIASAATVDLSAATGNYIEVTGSTGPITSFGTLPAGRRFRLCFLSTPTITHNATSMICPGGADLVLAANDCIDAVSLGSGNWRITSHQTGLEAFGLGSPGRITLESGVPDSVADLTAKTVIYFTPYKGNKIALWDGSNWGIHTLTQISLSVPGTTTTMYDLFVYNNSGTLTLEALAWTNYTTRSTAISWKNGVRVKSSDNTRRLVGSFSTTGVSGQTESSKGNRLISNCENQIEMTIGIEDDTDSHNYDTATIRQWENNTANQINFVLCNGNEHVLADSVGSFFHATNNQQVLITMGLDSTTARAADCVNGRQNNQGTTGAAEFSAHYSGHPGAGRHYLALLQRGSGVATNVWYGDSAQTFIRTGIRGVIKA